MNTGIDMLGLHFGLNRFIIKDASVFQYNPGVVMFGEAPKVWGKDRQGNEIAGSLFTNRGKKSGELVSLGINSKGLSIQFNPSKFFHPWNLLQVEHLDQSLDVVNESLNRHGIVLGQNLTDAAISRIDLTKQAQTPLPAGMYHPVFSTLQAKRARNTAMYPDGYSTGNPKSLMTTFYDKTAERKLNGIMDVPGNLTRCEVSYRTIRKISHDNRGLGLGSFEHLLNTNTPILNGKYNKHLRENVFRLEPDGIQMAMPFEADGLYDAFFAIFNHEAKGKKQVQLSKITMKWLASVGISNVMKYGGLNFIDALYDGLEIKSSTKAENKARVRKLIELESQLKAQAKPKKATTISDQRNYLLKLFAA